MTPSPLPRLAAWMLGRLPDTWRDSVEGDITEDREKRIAQGRPAGAIWITLATCQVVVRLCLEHREAARRGTRGRQGGPMMTGLAGDVAHAIKRLAADRSYTIVAIVTLALGLGAGAAVFTLANWLLFRPLPGVVDQDRLVAIGFGTGGARGPISVADFTALRTGVSALDDAAGYQNFPLHVSAAGTSTRVDAEVVSDRYFDVLRGAIAAGRGFSSEEALSPATVPTVVISHRVWQRELGGSRDAIGRALTINNHPFTIIGVTTRGFHGASLSGATDLWVPVGQHRLAVPSYPAALLTNRGSTFFFGVVGRLGDGATAELAGLQADAVRSRIAAAHPTDRRMATWRFDVQPGVEARPWVRERLSRAVALLLGAVALLLVLTCANVGNLMMARTISRRREIATRLALGASRLRVARLLLAETTAIAIAAGVAALGLAWAAAAALEGTVVLPGLPPLAHAEIDVRVGAFVLAMSMLVGIAATVVPALAARRIAPGAALGDGGRTHSTSGRRVRTILTTAQVAISVVLLLGAALLTRSMLARLSIDTGFDPSRVLSFSVEPGLQIPKASHAAFYRDLLARVRAVPGVHAAGLAWLRPFSQGAADTSFRLEGVAGAEEVSAELNSVSPGFFDALGLAMVEGRDFAEAEFLRLDTAGGGAVIVTESLARRISPTASAVGRRVVMEYPEGRVRTIVGVVRDTRQRRTVSVSTEVMFEPFGQTFSSGWASVVLGLGGPARDVTPLVRNAVAAGDRSLPIYDVVTLDAAVRQQFANELLLMRLMLAFAAVASVVAGVGLYGVLSRGVTDRRREFGIRAALGASPGSMARLITAGALRVLVAGLGLGFLASAGLARTLEGHLFGIQALDGLSIAAAAALVAIVTVLACVPAARRAAALDPAAELRS